MTDVKATAAKLRILAGTPVWVSDRARADLFGPLPTGAGPASANREEHHGTRS